MPKKEDKQRPLFYRKMTEQLQQAGIGVNPMPQYVSSRGKKQTGLSVKLLRLRCQGKGKYDQILKLMAELEKNPYLVSVEEIKIACDPKKREEMTLDMTVSTFMQ
jgi:hypothetical protein